jgi:micrococcal nuclease
LECEIVKPIFTIAAVCLFALAARADFTGTVARVLDGDTLFVVQPTKTNNPPPLVEIRLHWADAPEIAHSKSQRNQPFGPEAKARLEQLTANQQITVHETKGRSYGRTIAQLTDAQGHDINLALVQEGLAWLDPRFHPPAPYRAAQSAAQAARRGLWADPNPMPPWQWRTTHQASNHDPHVSHRRSRRHRR